RCACRCLLLLSFLSPATPATVVYALPLHRRSSDLARRLHRVVLLDEFQDTSVAQLEMLTDLFGPGHAACAEEIGEHLQLRHGGRSEEHTSELQSRFDLVCRPLLEKKNQSSYHVPAN